MAQRRHGGFGQKPHVQKADCQLAAKGAANAAMEGNFQDRSKSAERSRRPLSYRAWPADILPHTQTSPRIRPAALDCSAPFFLSTWKRAGVIRREHADRGPAAGVRFRARRHREHAGARCWPGRCRDAQLVFTLSFADVPGGPGCGTAPCRAGCNTSSPWRTVPGPGHRGRRDLEGLPRCCAPMPLPPPPPWRAAGWPARPATPGGWHAGDTAGNGRSGCSMAGPRGCGRTGPAAAPAAARTSCCRPGARPGGPMRSR